MRQIKPAAITAAMLSIFIITDALAEDAPDCGPDPRAADVPELLYSFDGLDHEGYETSLNSLRTQLPEWIESRDKWLRKFHPENDDDKIFQGEIFMAYFNFLTFLEGYALKLEYLSADETNRAEKEEQLCDFLLHAIIID